MYQIALGPRNQRTKESLPKDAAVCGDGVTPNMAIMGVMELYVPNSPWTQAPITGSTGSTES